MIFLSYSISCRPLYLIENILINKHVGGVHSPEEAWSWICISLPAFWKASGQGWVSEGSPEGVFFSLWWFCRKLTPTLGSILHGRQVLFSKERPLCSPLLYILGQKKTFFFFSLKFLDLPLSRFWTTISTVEFWTPIRTTGDTLESKVKQLSSAVLKALLGSWKNIKVSSWGWCI